MFGSLQFLNQSDLGSVNRPGAKEAWTCSERLAFQAASIRVQYVSKAPRHLAVSLCRSTQFDIYPTDCFLLARFGLDWIKPGHMTAWK